MNVVWKYATPVGDLWIGETGGAVSNVWFSESDVPASALWKETETLTTASRQLGEYFAGTRKVFNVPLAPVGTDFQRGVWDALLEIPYGETRTYGQIAAVIGNPNASRAVGLANNRNPIPVLIPCHRVIGSDGKLVGYGGGLEMKKRLLSLEGCASLPGL